MDENDRENLSEMLLHAHAALRLLGTTSEEAFLADEQKIHAVCRVLQIVGEAANRVTADSRSRLPAIPWMDVIGMRHRLVHGYREVRYEVVFKTVREDLPPLVAFLSRTLGEKGR